MHQDQPGADIRSVVMSLDHSEGRRLVITCTGTSMSVSQAVTSGLGAGNHLNVCQGALQLGVFLGQLVQAVSMLKL